MNTTYLNPVDIKAGEKFTFTSEGLSHIKPLVKKFDTIDFKGTFEIVQVRATNATGEDNEDSFECDELTTGAEIVKCVKTGQVIDLTGDNDPDYWSVFTNLTPHFYNKVAEWNNLTSEAK